MAYQPSDMVRGKVANFKIFNSFSSIFRNKAVDEPQVDLLCSFVFFMKIRSHEIYIRSTDTTAGGARAWGRSWQKRPVRPFQLQLCQLLPVAASISASTRCMWIPVHFGVHFGVHFAFFYQNLGEGKQDGRHGPLESPATAQ